MKKYILIGAVNGIGGWQLYCEARVIYMREQNVEVYVLYCNLDNCAEIKLSGFKSQNTYMIPYLCTTPYVYTRSQVKNIVQMLADIIDYSQNDEIFIESTSVSYALWGEILAEKTQGIHFVYPVQSFFEKMPEDKLKFLEFKYRQRLLAGINDAILPKIFEEYMEITNNYVVKASWKSPLCDENTFEELIESIETLKKEGWKVIGYFGTLNKAHFSSLCLWLQTYLKQHEDTNFIFISIGSSFTGKSEQAQMKIEKECKNCKCINVEEMYPVPKQIFAVMDVCIGSFGSGRVAAQAGAVTIQLENDFDLNPRGIIGKHMTLFQNKDYQICEESLVELLDNSVFSGIYEEVKGLNIDTLEDFRIRQAQADEFIMPFVKRENCYQYYDVLNHKLLNRYHKILRVLNVIFGSKCTYALLKLRFLLKKLRK